MGEFNFGREEIKDGISTRFRLGRVCNPFEKFIQVFLPVKPVVVDWMAMLGQLARLTPISERVLANA